MGLEPNPCAPQRETGGIMAIFSLNHRAIGKTTQKAPFTAAAHVLYILRARALTWSTAARMPGDAKEAASWFREQERADRKNARVADRLILALPRELTLEQQQALVTAFGEELTRGRVPWIGAIHARGKDAQNPHAHIVIRDRDPTTGERVLLFSAGAKERSALKAKGRAEAMTTMALRALWEREVNRSLVAAGRPERVDRRTLRARGIARKPQLHEGARARVLASQGRVPPSKPRKVRSRVNRRKGSAATREVDYAAIDRGKTRTAYNQSLRAEIDARRPRPPSHVPAQLPEGLRPRVQAPPRDDPESSGRPRSR